jgi:hypothetical protein
MARAILRSTDPLLPILLADPSGRSFWPILLADPSGRSFWPILLADPSRYEGVITSEVTTASNVLPLRAATPRALRR